MLGDNSEKNYRLYANGTAKITDKVYTPGLSIAAVEDTIVAKASDGELKAIPYPSLTGFAVWDSLFWSRKQGHLWPKTVTDSVGIGTASPSKLFHVYGSELIKDSLYFSSSNHYITEGEEGMGLKTDELFLARWMKIDGNKVGYPLLQGSNNVNVS